MAHPRLQFLGTTRILFIPAAPSTSTCAGDKKSIIYFSSLLLSSVFLLLKILFKKEAVELDWMLPCTWEIVRMTLHSCIVLSPDRGMEAATATSTCDESCERRIRLCAAGCGSSGGLDIAALGSCDQFMAGGHGHMGTIAAAFGNVGMPDGRARCRQRIVSRWPDLPLQQDAAIG
jgi:hypothetical protein